MDKIDNDVLEHLKENFNNLDDKFNDIIQDINTFENDIHNDILIDINEKIEEIYTLCDAALTNGQGFFRVHSFPFRLTDKKLASLSQHKWHDFWKKLQPGFLHFEESHRPPNVTVEAGQYAFGIE